MTVGTWQKNEMKQPRDIYVAINAIVQQEPPLQVNAITIEINRIVREAD